MPYPEGLAVGDKIPLDIALPNQAGETVHLGRFGERNLVIYFYPADDTPGCTVEGKEFRELADQFAALDCVIIGISVDSVESHRAFAEKHGLGFTLLADVEGAMARRFGVFKDGLAQRSTFVVDGERIIRRRYDNVLPRGHAQRVLDFVRSLLESHRMLGG